MIHHVTHWLYYFFGLESAENSHYLFWSGIGIGMLSILAFVAAILRVGWTITRNLDKHHHQMQRHIDYKIGQLDTEVSDGTAS